MKVNDWVSISIINLPEDKNVSSTVTFTNRNLENMDTFKNYIAFSDGNTSGNINTHANEKKNPLADIEAKEKDAATNKAKQDELDENFPKKHKQIQKLNTMQSSKEFDTQAKEILTDEPDEIVDKILKKEYRINEKNATEKLKIGVVENFVKKYIKENPEGRLRAEADKAKVDYEWQKELIRYLEDNMNNKIRVRDSLINKLYEEKKELNATRIKHNLPIVKIQNFDNTEFNITIENKDKQTKELITLPFRNKNGQTRFQHGFHR